MPDNSRPDDELGELEQNTSDGADVVEGLDPNITQDADPHPGA